MARKELPYPPAPEGVPEGLTSPSPSYFVQMIVVMFCLLVFFVLYVGLMLGSAFLVYFSISEIGNGDASLFTIVLMFLGGTICLFLFRGLFRDAPEGKNLQIEITENDHPTLFAFIRQLCEETKAPLPYKVFVSPEVNAAVMSNPSVVNLIIPPRRNLLIGLGLVNAINLSEFKAVLAHEFGHFAQKGTLGMNTYVYLSMRIMNNLVNRRDWLDRNINSRPGGGEAQIVAWVTLGGLWLIRKTMALLLRITNFLGLGMSRQMEFNADLVAVSVTGSDAIVHALSRLDFAVASLDQSFNEVKDAIDHQLYSSNVFLHQAHAVQYLRKKLKDPNLGQPPGLKRKNGGKRTRVFRYGDTSGIPPMWASHPANYLREENAKTYFVPGVVDERSPWILFDDAEELQARMSRKIYRLVFELPKDIELTDARKVQKFIDDEHAEVTYHPRYHGAYDGRPVEPGDIGELLSNVTSEPWEEDRLLRVHSKLYNELDDRMQDRNARVRDFDWLLGYVNDQNAPREVRFKNEDITKKEAKRKLDKLDELLTKDTEWFQSFDRRVFLVHSHMANKVDPEAIKELARRYRFQLSIQSMYKEMTGAQREVNAATDALVEESTEEGLRKDFFDEVRNTFLKARQSLKKVLKNCSELTVPTMNNFDQKTDLREFLLRKQLLREPKEHSISADWIRKLMQQLEEVRDRLARLHFKSMGTILGLQERIAAAFLDQVAPEAEEVEDEEANIPDAILED